MCVCSKFICNIVCLYERNSLVMLIMILHKAENKIYETQMEESNAF